MWKNTEDNEESTGFCLRLRFDSDILSSDTLLQTNLCHFPLFILAGQGRWSLVHAQEFKMHHDMVEQSWHQTPEGKTRDEKKKSLIVVLFHFHVVKWDGTPRHRHN